MVWKTVNAAQSMDAQSQHAFIRFANILMTHRNAHGYIQYNPQDKSYRLVNDNGIFYSNGRFFSRSGAKGNYDINTGNFLKKKVNKPATSVKQQSSTGSKGRVSQVTNPNHLYGYKGTNPNHLYGYKGRVSQVTNPNYLYGYTDIVSWVTNPSYLYGYKGQVNKQNKIPTNSPATNKSRTTLAPKTSTSNSWINKGRGIWNYSRVSQADVANAYKTGDFSKVGSYLSQHKDLTSYLNNVYSKRGGNQFNQSAQTPTVNTMTLQTLNNVVPKSPVKEITPTAELPAAPTPTYNRSQTRDYMRSIGMNPYDYSGSERKALRTYLNNPGSMDSKYQPFIDQVQNQRTQKMVNSIGTNQLLKPETDTNKLNNQLVNLKFEKGGQMYKYSVGAQMVQPQQAGGQQGMEQQAIALVQAAMQGDQKANQTIQKIMQAAQQGDQQAAQVAKLLQAIVQQMKGSRKARLGAKLDYIKQSIGECPEGQEVVYFKKGGEICKICAGKKMQDGGKSDPIKNFKKKKDVAKQTYQRNPYTRGKSAKEIAEMQRRNRQEASAGEGENDANVAPWNYKKKKMK